VQVEEEEESNSDNSGDGHCSSVSLRFTADTGDKSTHD
jgi:hypothetical protein